MEVLAESRDVQNIECDALVAGLFADGEFTPTIAALDGVLEGRLRRLRERGELTGKPNEIVVLHDPPGLKTPLLVVVGLGAADKFHAGTAYRAAAAAARSLSGKARRTVAFLLSDGPAAAWTASAVAGAISGTAGTDLYRAEKKRNAFERLLWSGANSVALARGTIVGESVNLARRLVNEPPSVMYPEEFAKQATNVAAECGLTCEVWDERRLKNERCGSLLAVASGSDRPSRLVILEHRGGKPDEPPIAIVGKGVTFDSGGLSLKPTDGMVGMKCDMAGAAAMLATMQALARLQVPVNVIGLAGLVENMLGGSAMKLGDVLHARSGKTIEVLNTDAEGRLVLADVLNVALERKAAKIVDLATLTGACVVALGTDVVGAFTNNQAWCDAVLGAARTAGEPIWQLPMFPEYSEHIRSEIADIKNTGDGRWGGAITAAKFLEEFVGQTPWVHLDIAGPAFLEKPKAWSDVGGTGCMVRTLVELLTNS
jgi:leucyl aminopeptidase